MTTCARGNVSPLPVFLTTFPLGFPPAGTFVKSVRCAFVKKVLVLPVGLEPDTTELKVPCPNP